MNDDVKAALERLRRVAGADTELCGEEFVSDVLEARTLLAHIDGEDERREAAVAAAVENFALEVDHERDERLERAEKAEAERDALFVSHANLAAVLADINEAVGGAAGEEPSLARAVRTLVADVAKLEADAHCPTCGSSVYTCVDCDVAPLRAQVEAARAWAAKNTEPVEGDGWAHGYDLLRAMDGAKP